MSDVIYLTSAWIMAWMTNYTPLFSVDVITYACPNLTVGSANIERFPYKDVLPGGILWLLFDRFHASRICTATNLTLPNR